MFAGKGGGRASSRRWGAGREVWCRAQRQTAYRHRRGTLVAVDGDDEARQWRVGERVPRVMVVLVDGKPG
eukprot:9775-Eustigmatos_ZCMA.PRE.1